MKVTQVANLPFDESGSTAHELEQINSLLQVLAWANAKPKVEFIPEIVSAVVAQDEYTNDVIVPHKEHYLVFDTT